jgi:cell division protein FtsN
MGVILFYIATGKLPFKGKNKLIVLNKQLNERPPRPSEAREDIEVPLRLEAVILKCLNKEPEERYQSADDLLEALEEAKSASGTMNTAAGGTARLGAVSSEVADTAADTPSQPHQTDAPGIHDSETVAYGNLDSPLNTDPERAADVELGEIDDSDEAVGALDEVDLAREWAEREEVTFEENRSWRIVAGALVAVMVAGVLVWALGSDGPAVDGDNEGAAGAQIENPPAQGPAAPQVDINRVLVTGQVIGSLSAAEDNLRHGDVGAAKRALDATYMWMDDDELPKEARKRRRELAARIAREQKSNKEKSEQANKPKPVEKPQPKPAEKPKPQPVEKPKPAEKPVEKPAEKPAEKKPTAQEEPPAETEPPKSTDGSAEESEGKDQAENTDGFALPPKRLD